MENGINTQSTTVNLARRASSVIAALLVLVALAFNTTVFAQTYVPPAPGQDWTTGGTAQLSQGAGSTDQTSRYVYDSNGQTTLVQEQAEQSVDAVAQNVESKLWPAFGSYNDTYEGLAAFWGDDIISNLFANIGQLIGKWLSEFIDGWVSDAVQFLTGFLRIFVLNPNIATNGLTATGGVADDISPYIRQGADAMYGIAVDLLLLLFILCIWKYWAEAAWRGGGNLMGAVGRLIFTAGLMLAWPTIYAFEIQITNEMISAIYFNSADQVAMLDAAMSAAVKAGLVAGAGLLANATAPVAGQVLGGLLGGGAGGIILGTVGSFVAFVGLIIYLVLGGILIAELIYILVLKAIQTALLCAQYMFAPIFIVFFATPDTENITAGFVRSFVEVSLWTFVWVGLLKIMVIVVLSDFNPWGKIIFAVGVLQLMIQVPSFLARAQVSPMSDFISAGLITGGLLSAGKVLGNTLSSRAMHMANAVGNFGYAGAKGSPKSQNVDLNVPQGVNNQDLLDKKRKAEKTGVVDPTNPGGGQNLNPGDANGPNGPKGPKGNKAGENPATTPQPPGKDLNGAKGAGAGAGDGAPGTPGAKDPNAANAAAQAASTAGKGLAGAGVAAAVGAGLAAAQGGAATAGTPGAQTGDEAARQLSANNAAEALKALQNRANQGPNGPKAGEDQTGKEINAAASGPNGAKDANSKLEGAKGATDAKLNDKGAKTGVGTAATAAAAAAALANMGKDVKPGDLANAGDKAGVAGPGGGKGAQLDVDVERDADGNPKTGVPGAPNLGGLKTGPDGTPKGDLAGADASGRTSVKAPGADGGAAPTLKTDANVNQKPGAGPKGAATVVPAASASLADATSKIDRGTADPTTVAVNSDVAPDGDPGAPLQQARGNSINAASGQSGPVPPPGNLSAADLAAAAGAGAAAGAAGAKLAGQTTVEQRTGQSRTASPTGAADSNATLTGQGRDVTAPGAGPGLTPPAQVGAVNTDPGAIDMDPTTGRTTATVNMAPGQTVQPPSQVNNAELGLLGGAAAAAGAAAVKTGQQQVDARLQPGTRTQATGAPTGRADGNAQIQAPAGGNVIPPPGINPSQVSAQLDPSMGAEVDPMGRTQANVQMTGAPGVNPGTNSGVNPADIAAAAATGAAAGAAMRPGQQSVDARIVGGGRPAAGGAPNAPPTQFTQAQRMQAGGGGPTPPPVNYTNMDGGGPDDDGTGGNGGGFNGAGNIPAAGRPGGGGPTPPGGAAPHPDVIEGYNQAGYNKVPFRVGAANIRLAQGATIGRSGTGQNYAIYDNQGHVMHYRFDESASQEQKGMAIIAGSLGELMSTDAEAYDAARTSAISAGEHKPQGAMERMAAGVLAYNGSSWTQTAAAKQRFARSMAKHAAIGAQAYISRDSNQANAYTEFLENRYGAMDDDRQAEAVHIMTTDTTPESGWSWRLQPATEALIQNGIGINPLNRACAANMAVLKAQPWLRGAAIRGSAAYIESKGNAAIPDGTHAMVKDSWYAHHAQAMTPETVNCVGALTLATGDTEICRNAPLIDQVVSMVPAGGRPEDYVGAYNSLTSGMAVVSNITNRSSGGGGTIRQSAQMSGGGGGGGTINAPGGTVSTNVQGRVVNSGGGANNNAELDLFVDSPAQSGAMPNINPNSLNLGGAAPQPHNTTVNVRTHTGSGQGQNLGTMSARVTAPGGSSPGRVDIGNIQNAGGSSPATDQVTVDVEISDNGAPGSSYADIQGAAVSSALQYFGGNSTELVKNVVADLRASGMSWNDIQNPNVMATAVQSYSTNPNSLPQVAIAANAMGADKVTTAHVEMVQDMQDADPRWDNRSIDYGAIYTSQCIVEAHMANPQTFGQPYLTKDYVDKVRLDPRFKPRAVPMRGANGQVAYEEKTPVPSDLILNHLQEQMRRFGGG